MPETSVMSNNQSYRLLFVIDGEYRVFGADVLRNVQVGDLKVVIQRERSLGILKDVNPYILELWKPKDSNPIAGSPEGTLAERIGSLGGSLSNFADKLEVSTASLFSIFPNQPPLRHLHIIVRIPATNIRQKRALSEPIEDVFDRLKRAIIVTGAPSDIAKPEIYEQLQQEPSEKILDDRPEPDADIPPISLLYKGFGHFLDIMDGRDDVPGLVDVDVRELRNAVDDLASTMTGYFSQDDGRRDAALLCLTRIFSARRGIKIPPLHAAAIGSVTTYGHNTATHGAGTIVVQCKNWSVGVSTLPQVELACFVARLNATGMDEVDTCRQLYLRWRVPCIGLTIVGCDITFYAVVAIDHRFRLISLTPKFSCIQSASDGRDRTSLYSAFIAASVLQAHILQDAEKLLNNLPPAPIPARARHFPAVSKLRKHPPSHDDYLTFEIRNFFPDREPYRLLYLAEMPGIDKQLILIKFSRRYSIELHDFCAKSGHAPPILGFERLPGGWCAVAMEYIESSIPINRADLPAHRDRWTDELKCLMDNFHAEGLVHGDLRDANMICKQDRVMLIDFDWGGKDGEVFYPTPNLNDELLQGRVSDDLRITKEDDRRVLKKTVAKVMDIHRSALYFVT